MHALLTQQVSVRSLRRCLKLQDLLRGRAVVGKDQVDPYFPHGKIADLLLENKPQNSVQRHVTVWGVVGKPAFICITHREVRMRAEGSGRSTTN